MKSIEIFDPALCCPTGLCGPDINPELIRMAAAVELLKKNGVPIERHNLKDVPHLYVENKIVNKYLMDSGAEGLPVTLVDGALAVSGKYPSNEQLTEWTGVSLDVIPVDL